MPNIKSSAKRDALSKERNAKNRAARTQMRTNLKKFDAAVAQGDSETAVSAYKVAVKTIDHAATKNLIHKNCAAHKKSQLAKKLNSVAQ